MDNETTKTVADLQPGDSYPHPLFDDGRRLTVDHIKVTTSKKWMSEVPIIAIYFVEKTVMKNTRVAGDQPVR